MSDLDANARHVPALHDDAPHLLVVDDDARLRDLLDRYLSKQGWLVTCARDAADARAKLRYFVFDLVVLDVMMPHETGVAFATDFRKHYDTPILMLTAMGEVQDRIAGLEAGADDYLAKPFEPRELVLRITQILKRTKRAVEDSQMVHFGDYTLNVTAKRLQRGDEPLHLTENEMQLLLALAEQLGQPVARERLMQAIAGEEDASSRSVDVLMTRLRRKIEDQPSRPLWLQTVRGEGYRLRP